jgi:hypothetical protein
MPAPEAVLLLAEKLPQGSAIAARLLSNPRMELIWKKLLQLTPVKDCSGILRKWDADEYGFVVRAKAEKRSPAAELAVAKLFEFIVFEFNQKRELRTDGEIEREAARWKDAADICKYVSHDPMFCSDTELQAAAAIVARQLTMSAELIRSTGAPISEGAERRASHVLRMKNRQGDIEASARIHTTGLEMKDLFGTSKPALLTVIVSVAMDRAIEIEKVKKQTQAQR